tara:strand:+ start:676 stop:1038 length:363 start_codon:yes stop_codon:yes gene_type:complete
MRLLRNYPITTGIVVVVLVLLLAHSFGFFGTSATNNGTTTGSQGGVFDFNVPHDPTLIGLIDEEGFECKAKWENTEEGKLNIEACAQHNLKHNTETQNDCPNHGVGGGQICYWYKHDDYY